jgi:hypothetical protein
MLEPPVAPDIDPQPPGPEPKNRRWMWAIPIAVTAVVGVGVALAHVAPTADTATPGVCGTDWLTVRPTTFNGVALNVAIPGPDTVTVDLWGSFDEHRRLDQQVTAGSGGASFVAWDFQYKIETIDVSLKNGAHCAVSASILGQLNTANGHS